MEDPHGHRQESSRPSQSMCSTTSLIGGVSLSSMKAVPSIACCCCNNYIFNILNKALDSCTVTLSSTLQALSDAHPRLDCLSAATQPQWDFSHMLVISQSVNIYLYFDRQTSDAVVSQLLVRDFLLNIGLILISSTEESFKTETFTKDDVLLCVSEHRGAGEGDVEWPEAAGSCYLSWGLPHPQTEGSRGQVCIQLLFINPQLSVSVPLCYFSVCSSNNWHFWIPLFKGLGSCCPSLWHTSLYPPSFCLNVLSDSLHPPCRFPLFTAVYQICFEGKPVQEMISCLQSHPEHLWYLGGFHKRVQGSIQHSNFHTKTRLAGYSLQNTHLCFYNSAAGYLQMLWSVFSM